MTPLESYQHDVTHQGFQLDEAQQRVAKSIQSLYEALLSPPEIIPTKHFFSFLNKKSIKPIKGLYCWGGVGRGKSYLVDRFFDCLPFKEKKRIHFNQFMQDIHGALEGLPKTPDPLVIVARKLAEKYRVICIDEFHVDDITDAMIMTGFLHALYSENVTLVCTSNIAPEKLYKNGLQRERFLPAIALIKENSHVLQLDNGLDYRRALFEKQGTFHVVEKEGSTQVMQQHLLGSKVVAKKQTIQINSRSIQCRARAENLIWFDFDALCQTARSSRDYMLLAQDFKMILISDIPEMNDSHNDIAQRFIQLIDALYDNRVVLVVTAAVQPEQLYQGKSLAFPFKRTVSRLIEMRSESYQSKS